MTSSWFKAGVNCCLFLLLSVTATLQGFAQDHTILPTPVAPMSPNASALAVYCDYPVSHYTGIPSISVPLYDINIDGFKLPITLSYHASGIKVNQEASMVGLGWALNIGGAISRTVKGYDDFLEYPAPSILKGYYEDQDIQNVNSDYYYDYYFVNTVQVRRRLKFDTEPDIFYYSLPGASGKFIIDKSRGPVLMDVNPNVKIEIIHDPTLGSFWKKNLCFSLTTPDGTQYYYKQRETTYAYSNTTLLNQNSTAPNRILDAGIGTNPAETYTSSWLLDKITTVNKRVISFQYQQETYESPTQESCIKHTYMGLPSGQVVCEEVPNNGSLVYSTNKARYETLRLYSVSWDGGHINLNSSSREDMKGWNSIAPPKKIDGLSVYNLSDDLVKEIKFNYSYFNENYTGQYDYVLKRLKLENVVIDNDSKNKYLFHYNPGEILAKNSNNADYWGYHNGKIYGAEYFVGLTIGGTIYPGANKSSNITFMKTGILNEIVYPTGGSTNFQYEANTFSENEFAAVVPVQATNDEKIIDVYNEYSTVGEFEGIPSSGTYQFTSDRPFRISILKYIENPVCPAFDPDFVYENTAYLIGGLKRFSPTVGYVRTFPMPQIGGRSSYCDYTDTGFSQPVSASSFNGPEYPPGTYVFEAFTPPKNIYVRWRLNFLYSQSPESGSGSGGPVAGGGLRISKIITANQVKNYTYPTGRLMIAPVLAYGKTYNCVVSIYHPEHGGTTTHEGSQKILRQLSNSSIPLSTLRNSNAVGYDWVDESITGAGKTRYSFYNEQEEPLEEASYADTSFPYAPSVINYHNGLTQKIEFFKVNSLLKSIEFNYEPRSSATISGFMFDEMNGRTLWYGYKIAWLLKQSEVIKTYIGANPIEEVTTYAYNDDFQPLVVKKLVNGIWEEKRFKYARDFSSPVYQSMVNSHQISVPIETISLKNNLVVAANKIAYFQSQDLNLPQEVYTLNATQPLDISNYQNFYRKMADFEIYNANGKLLQLNQRGKITSYLWGYNNYFLVAQINGASHAQVTGAIGSPAVTALGLNPSDSTIETNANLLRSSLSSAQVESFTFKPMVGVTGITNERGLKTSYVYNAVNKLDHVKDHLGNMLKSYTYHFRGNSTPYTVVDLGIPTSYEELAFLERNGSAPFPGRFRVTLLNKYTGVKYTYDIDASTQRIGGVPPSQYDLSVVNLDNIPLSNFNIQIYGADFTDGVYEGESLDAGGNRFRITYVGP